METKNTNQQTNGYSISDATSAAVSALEELTNLGGSIIDAISKYNGGDDPDLIAEYIEASKPLEEFLGKLILLNVKQNLAIIPEDNKNRTI